QVKTLPSIGFLGASTSLNWTHWTNAFVRRLAELGWIDGRTVTIEYRWAEGRSERFAEIAAEFVRLKVDVIVTVGGAALAVRTVTPIIPIVLAAATDPLGGGLVASLARPGGNTTGLSMQSSDAAGKRLDLLRELLPGLRRLAVIGNVEYPATVQEIAEVRAAYARSRSRPAGNQPCRRYRRNVPGAQGRLAGTLCVCQPARERQPRSYQHPSARRAGADDACGTRFSRGGRFHVLWT